MLKFDKNNKHFLPIIPCAICGEQIRNFDHGVVLSLPLAEMVVVHNRYTADHGKGCYAEVRTHFGAIDYAAHEKELGDFLLQLLLGVGVYEMSPRGLVPTRSRVPIR